MSKKSTKSSNNPEAALVASLTQVLADTYVLMVKAHGYHWNVTGPLFPQLHEFFEKIYRQLFTAADDIAERVRALDAVAIGSMAQMLEKTTLTEATSKPPAAKAMVSDLVKSYEKNIVSVKACLELADELDDEASEDLMIKLLGDHEKTLWMLKSQVA